MADPMFSVLERYTEVEDIYGPPPPPLPTQKYIPPPGSYEEKLQANPYEGINQTSPLEPTFDVGIAAGTLKQRFQALDPGLFTNTPIESKEPPIRKEKTILNAPEDFIGRSAQTVGAMSAGGIAGLGTFAFNYLKGEGYEPSLRKGAKVVEKTQTTLGPTPGKDIFGQPAAPGTEQLEYIFDLGMKAAMFVGDKTTELAIAQGFSPETSANIGVLTEVALIIAGGYATTKAIKSPRGVQIKNTTKIKAKQFLNKLNEGIKAGNERAVNDAIAKFRIDPEIRQMELFSYDQVNPFDPSRPYPDFKERFRRNKEQVQAKVAEIEADPANSQLGLFEKYSKVIDEDLSLLKNEIDTPEVIPGLQRGTAVIDDMEISQADIDAALNAAGIARTPEAIDTPTPTPTPLERIGKGGLEASSENSWANRRSAERARKRLNNPDEYISEPLTPGGNKNTPHILRLRGPEDTVVPVTNPNIKEPLDETPLDIPIDDNVQALLDQFDAGEIPTEILDNLIADKKSTPINIKNEELPKAEVIPADIIDTIKEEVSKRGELSSTEPVNPTMAIGKLAPREGETPRDFVERAAQSNPNYGKLRNSLVEVITDRINEATEKARRDRTPQARKSKIPPQERRAEALQAESKAASEGATPADINKARKRADAKSVLAGTIPTDAPISAGSKVFHGTRKLELPKVNGVLFDPRQRNRIGSKSVRDIVADAQLTYQEVRNRVNPETQVPFTHEEAISHPDVRFFDDLLRQRNELAEKIGIQHEGRLPSVDEFRKLEMEAAVATGRKFYELQIDAEGNLNAREIPTKAIEAELELNKGDAFAPTELNVSEKVAKISNDAKTHIGVSLDDLETAIEIGDVSILDDVHPTKRDAVRDFYELQRSGLDSDVPRSGTEIFNDIVDFVSSFLKEEKGSVNFNPDASFTSAQKMQLQRLQADAKRLGRDLVDLMQEAGGAFTQSQIALSRAYLEGVRPSSTATAITFPQDTVLGNLGNYNVGQVFEQRVRGKNVNQPRNVSDIEALQNANILPANLKIPALQKFVTTPRMLQQAGITDPFQYAARTVTEATNIAVRGMVTESNAIFKGLTRNERRNITANGYARTPEGRAINLHNGVVPQPLNAAEQAAMNYIDRVNAARIKEINEVRVGIGLDPIAPIDNYFTHARTINWLESIGDTSHTNLGTTKAADLHNKYVSNKSTSFPNEKTRKGGRYSAEYDARKVFQTYHRRALNHIHMSPFNARVHELISRPLPNPATGEYDWYLHKENPALYQGLREWNNFLSGRQDMTKLTSPFINKVMTRLNDNLVASLLSWNFRSAAIQPMALVNTATEVGSQFLLRGSKAILEDSVGIKASRIDPRLSNREFAMQHSRLLEFRGADVMVEQVASSLRQMVLETRENITGIADAASQVKGIKARIQSNKLIKAAAASKKGATPSSIAAAGRKELFSNLGEATGPFLDVALATQKTLSDAGLSLLRVLDFESALVSWDAAMRRGLSNNLSIPDAAKFADDVVTRTQGSSIAADISPIQRTPLGRFFTLFQTFAINEFGFLKRDVLGLAGTVDPRSVSAGSWKKIVTFTAGTMIVNSIIESEYNPLRINSPRPRPIKDFIEGYQSGGVVEGIGKASLGMFDLIPGVAQITRYGEQPGPPVIGAIVNLANAFQDRPFSQSIARTGATLAGVPGTSQISRYSTRRERGESILESLGGYYDPNKDTSNSGKLRRGGLRGGSGRGGIKRGGR